MHNFTVLSRLLQYPLHSVFDLARVLDSVVLVCFISSRYLMSQMQEFGDTIDDDPVRSQLIIYE